MAKKATVKSGSGGTKGQAALLDDDRDAPAVRGEERHDAGVPKQPVQTRDIPEPDPAPHGRDGVPHSSRRPSGNTLTTEQSSARPARQTATGGGLNSTSIQRASY
jgi:hypothetical protein